MVIFPASVDMIHPIGDTFVFSEQGSNRQTVLLFLDQNKSFRDKYSLNLKVPIGFFRITLLQWCRLQKGFLRCNKLDCSREILISYPKFQISQNIGKACQFINAYVNYDLLRSEAIQSTIHQPELSVAVACHDFISFIPISDMAPKQIVNKPHAMNCFGKYYQNKATRLNQLTEKCIDIYKSCYLNLWVSHK